MKNYQKVSHATAELDQNKKSTKFNKKLTLAIAKVTPISLPCGVKSSIAAISSPKKSLLDRTNSTIFNASLGLVTVLGVTLPQGITQAATFTATWDGSTANWGDPTHWDIMQVPNNNGATTYDAIVNAVAYSMGEQFPPSILLWRLMQVVSLVMAPLTVMSTSAITSVQLPPFHPVSLQVS